MLESDLLAVPELEDGSLVPAIDDTETRIVSYYLVYPEDHMHIPKVVAFIDWITGKANDYSDDRQCVSD